MTTLSKKLQIATIAGMAAALVMAAGPAVDMALAGAMPPAQTGHSQTRAIVRQDAIYADGVYTATGYYGGLPSSITVTVTLVDGLITAVEVTSHATNPTSLDLQQRFAAAVPAVVVGKPLDEVYVGRLAGSSGTPEGFNAAIQQIKEQAMSAAAQLATPVATPVATPDGETA